MSDLNDTKFNSGSSPANLENDVTNSRRDFLKKTGKFAVYTPPAMLMLMHPSANAMTYSVRAVKGNNGIGQEKRGISDGPPPGLAEKPNIDFNDNGSLGQSGAQAGRRPK